MLDRRDIQTLMYCIRVTEISGQWQSGYRARTAIAEALAALAPGASPPRPGRPHITLARLRFGLRGELARLDDAPAAVPVERVDLMESIPVRGGVRYERLAAVPFRPLRS